QRRPLHYTCRYQGDTRSGDASFRTRARRDGPRLARRQRRGAGAARAHRRRARRCVRDGQDDHREARGGGRAGARREPRPHDLLRAGRAAGARPQADGQGLRAPAVRRRLEAAVHAAAAGRGAERRRARVPSNAARAPEEEEMIGLAEMVLTASLVSGAAALCLALVPHAPPRLRFRIALAGLAAWVVPWPLLSIPVEIPMPAAIAGPAASAREAMTLALDSPEADITEAAEHAGSVNAPAMRSVPLAAVVGLLFLPG